LAEGKDRLELEKEALAQSPAGSASMQPANRDGGIWRKRRGDEGAIVGAGPGWTGDPAAAPPATTVNRATLFLRHGCQAIDLPWIVVTK
jgi:hypothetical protein